MANDLGNKSVDLYIDDTAAHDALERLQSSADKFNKKIDEGRAKQKQLTDAIEKAKNSGASYTKLERDLKKVNTELGKNEKALTKTLEGQKKIQEQIDNKTGPSLRQQEALVRRLENEYKNLGQNTQEAARKLEELGKASENLNVMRDRLNSVKKAQDGAAKAGSSFFGSFLGNLAANAITRVSALLEGFFDDAVNEALEAEESTARFQATLSNLGRSDSFDRIAAKADQMAEKFKNLDNDEIIGVYNKLIDYGKLTEKQMNDLLPVIIDFGAKQRISLEESTSVIVKALEGSGKALKEYGIDIKDAETDTERLNVVMTTLKEKVDGAGEAFLNSAQGGIAAARQEIANTKEEIGTGLIPMINSALKAFNYFLIGTKDVASRIKNTFSDIAAFSTGGWAAVVANHAERDAEKILEINDKTAAAFIESMQGKSDEEITAALIELQQKIADKQRYLKTVEAGIKNGTNTQLDKSNAQAAVTLLKQQLDLLLKYQDSLSNTEVLGLGGTTEKNKTKEKPKKDTKADQAKKDLEELEKIIQKKQFDLDQFGVSAREKELEELRAWYEEKKKLAHGNKAAEEKLMKEYHREIIQINQKYRKEDAESQRKKEEEAEKQRQQRMQNMIVAGVKSLQNVRAATEAAMTAANWAKLDALELQLLRASGFKKLQAEKALLEEMERQEIEAARQRGENTELIEEQYRQRKREKEVAFYTEMAGLLLQFAQGLAEIQSLDNQIKTNRENAELSRLQKKNDKEKASHQKLLNGKLISQQEYNKKIKEIDDRYRAQEAATKKKQWERQQKADIIAARISGAQAILSALQTKPFLLGLALSIVAGIRTSKQIDLIKSQPVPEFEKGTYLQGPLHKDGGMPIINPRTGRKVAEVEGGEVILSRKTVRNNPQLVGALLHSSMYGEGKPILPAFRSRTYKALDYAGLAQSVKTVRFYENGGSIPATIASDGSAPANQVVPVPVMTPEQEQLLQAVYKRLSEPAKAYVVLSEYEAAAGTMASIKEDSTFKKQR